MSKVKYNDIYSYEVFKDGYDIYTVQGGRVLTQRDPYGKLFDQTKNYKENAILHLESLTETAPEPGPTPTEVLKADIDYIALMNDIVLPSQAEEFISEEGE